MARLHQIANFFAALPQRRCAKLASAALAVATLLVLGATLVNGQTPASPAAANANAERLLPDAAKAKFVQRMKNRSADERAAAVLELASFIRDPETIKLVLQYGLRDRDDAVATAAAQALAEARTIPAIGQLLLDQLRQETSGKKRGNIEFAQRLVGVICRFRMVEIYRPLLRYAEESDAAGAQFVIETMMREIDKAAQERDVAMTPILEILAASRAFGTTFGFRRCVIDAAMRLDAVDAVSFLVRQLGQLDGEVRHSIVTYLRRISRQQLATETAVWEKWWNANRATFKFAEPLAAESAENEQGTPVYYDLPIRAKRLVFILDTSKSMEAATTITRLEAAKRALIATIDQLPEQTLFNIVVFNTTVGVWQDKLAPATERWKILAKAFVQSQRPNGKTATYDALQAAFKLDPNLEAIYLLSDGAPSAGAVIPAQMLLDAIAKQNRVRRVTINTIGVFGGGEGDELETFMQRLATENNGQFRRAN